ncbi:MAG: glycosyltransferase family 39 protein [Spirochaetes bacterium]|nr:glycosyltransferase family 39 protein [Spirochaetota bacterium]
MLENVIKKINSLSTVKLVAMITVILSLFFIMALLRLIDGDEGFYILASHLAASGKKPYLDFFYPQTPLLPYVYGFWMKIFGYSWYSARALSALSGVAIGFLLYFHVEGMTKKKAAGLMAVIIYALSSFSFGWYTTVKTYGISIFFLFSSYALLFARDGSLGVARSFLSGMLLGISVGTRLFFVAAVPAFLIGILFAEKEPKRRYAYLGLYLLGFAVAMIPIAAFFIISPDNFMFNNLGYHRIRLDTTIVESIGQKVKIAFELVGFNRVEGAASLQFFLLLVASIMFFRWKTMAKSPAMITSTGIMLVIGITNFLPTPTYVQYFSALMPFFAVIITGMVNAFYEDSRSGPSQTGQVGTMLAVMGIIYAIASFSEMYRFTYGGQYVQGIVTHENAPNWSIPTVRKITSDMERLSEGDRAVISWWPGYFISSSCMPMEGMENHFGLDVEKRLPREKLIKYHLVSSEIIDERIRKGDIRVVVLGNWAWDDRKLHYRDLLKKNGYERAETVYDAELFVLKKK